MNVPQILLLRTEKIRHRADASAGPRVERIEHYLVDGQPRMVTYWYENGRLHHVV